MSIGLSRTRLTLEALEDRSVPAGLVPNSNVAILYPVFAPKPELIGRVIVKGPVSIDPQPFARLAVTLPGWVRVGPQPEPPTVARPVVPGWVQVGPQPEPPTIVGVIR